MISSIQGFSAGNYLEQVKGVAPVKPVAAKPQEQQQSQQTQQSDQPLQSGNLLAVSSELLTLLQADSTSSSTSLESLISSNTGGGLESLLQDTNNQAPSSSIVNVLKNPATSGQSASELLFEGLGIAASLQQNGSTGILPAPQAPQSEQSPVQGAIQPALSAYREGINAYNKVLLDNAQAVIEESQQALDNLIA